MIRGPPAAHAVERDSLRRVRPDDLALRLLHHQSFRAPVDALPRRGQLLAGTDEQGDVVAPDRTVGPPRPPAGRSAWPSGQPATWRPASPLRTRRRSARPASRGRGLRRESRAARGSDSRRGCRPGAGNESRRSLLLRAMAVAAMSGPDERREPDGGVRQVRVRDVATAGRRRGQSIDRRPCGALGPGVDGRQMSP